MNPSVETKGLIIPCSVALPSGNSVFLEPADYRRGGGPKPLTAEQRVARFWSKVNQEGPVHAVLGTRCWIWTGSLFKNGYGQFHAGRLPDGRLRTKHAHRIAYELLVGPIPEGLEILHRCDVRHCVRAVDHLRVDTHAENIRDGFRKGRYPEERPGAWTVDADLRAYVIEQCLFAPRGRLTALCNQYDLSFRTMYMAVHRARLRRLPKLAKSA